MVASHTLSFGSRDEVLQVQKPVIVACHDGECETLGILFVVQGIRERGVEEDWVYVSGRGARGARDMG